MSETIAYDPFAHRSSGRLLAPVGWPGRAPAGSLGGMDDTTVADIDETTSAETDLLDDELLVEEISIDGMCGVY